MPEYICPSCGKDLPSAMGQHATDLVSWLVTCPHCGAEVTLREGAVESPSGDYAAAAAAPPGRTEGTDPPGDLNATPDYKRHLARVLTRRALELATGA